jgi:hypothetical protein
VTLQRGPHQPTKPRAHVIPRYALRLLLDDIYPAKPKSFCKRGSYALFAIQNRIELGAINVITLREGGLTSLAFDCRLEQINDVVIIKHRQIARFARRAQSDAVGTSLITGHLSIERDSRCPQRGRLPSMSPTPQSRPKDRAELRTADGEMMVVHIRGNGAAISRCF